MGRSCSINGTLAGGGGFRVLNLGGEVATGPLGGLTGTGWGLASAGGRRTEFSAGTGFLVTSGAGRRVSAGAGWLAGGTARFATARVCERTGGGVTGFPGHAASAVGAVFGGGITC